MRNNALRIYSAIMALCAVWALPAALAQVGPQQPTAGGNLVPGANIRGTPYALTPAAGMMGERLSTVVATGAAVALVNNTAKDIATLALTPGNWLCDAVIVSKPDGATTTSEFDGSISLTANTFDNSFNTGGTAWYPTPVGAGVQFAVPVGLRYVNVSAATTMHLVVLAGFAVSTMSAYGNIGCTRIY